MEMIVDFMLLAASGAAAFYCFILNKKLQSLKDTEKGLGATIATMSVTVEQARGAVAFARESSADSINALSPLISEARDVLPKLMEMIDVISELAEIAINDISDSASTAKNGLEEQIAAARDLLGDIQTQTTALNGLISVEGALAPSKPATVKEAENITYLDGAETSHSEASSRVTAALEKARQVHSKTKRAG